MATEHQNDPVFEAEQAHLTQTHAKLQGIYDAARAAVDERMAKAFEDRDNMLESTTWDLGTGVNLETYVEMESMHKVIDEYNLANDLDAERMAKARMLMRKPYFAKVSLQFKPGGPVRDVYIGAAGMTDETCKHFIVDWRSPVAEVYYNQANGQTSYEANGRTITCDLKLRRQFDVAGATLNGYFDTTVAIEDPLLLATLSRRRNAQMQDITATIQKEQNLVIRHADVPALLVNGIAGSGKTSVLLQRIAYLFYQQRENLDPKDVYLITPNPVFRQYIDHVLPDMGESNPQCLTWDDLMVRLNLRDRGLGKSPSAESLRRIDELLPTFELDQRDFQDIRVDDERVITAAQARGAYNHYKRLPAGIHRSSLAAEDLLEKLQQRINRLCREEDVLDTVSELSEQEAVQVFGHVPVIQDESELVGYARTWLEHRYAPVAEAIEDGAWLRIDRIGMRLLGQETLNAAEWLYLKLALAGGTERHARFVMVDEVQDYSEPQLMVLARYFNNAHFLLLGDQNQAIKPHTATFPQIKRIFQESRDQVCECELMTSYRSSPEITALFTSLMDPDERVRTSSIQRPGTEPELRAIADAAQYEAALKEAVAEALRDKGENGGLCAIIAPDADRIRQLAKVLDAQQATRISGPGDPSRVQQLGEGAPLPSQGVVLLDVALAKGLEFDQVIVTDAQERYYGTDQLSRNRLYTAISRATQQVLVLALGELSPLLA
ncbi:MAG: AAA family ATPase [Coriobacteriia bacterium]|nr:AAA family ATPase [Coriobacteriia bacterium]